MMNVPSTAELLKRTTTTIEPVPGIVVPTAPSTATSAGPTPSTSLPTSPTDGQQAILVDNTAAPTYAWLMQYSSTAAQWLFVGGSPAYASSTTSASSVSYADLASATFTVPRGGNYLVEWTANTNGNADSSAVQAYVNLAVAGTAIADAYAVMLNGAIARAGGGSTFYETGAIAASTILKLQAKVTSAGTVTCPRSTLKVTPIYVT